MRPRSERLDPNEWKDPGLMTNVTRDPDVPVHGSLIGLADFAVCAVVFAFLLLMVAGL